MLPSLKTFEVSSVEILYENLHIHLGKSDEIACHPKLVLNKYFNIVRLLLASFLYFEIYFFQAQ